MDPEHELKRAKWLLAALLIFLISGCMSWGELWYLVSGRTTQADITKDFPSRGGRFGTREQRTIEWAFAEPDGTRRGGTATVPLDWPAPTNGKIAVRYTPGAEGDSRLDGHVRWPAIIVFSLSLAGLVLFGYRMYREAHA